MSNSRAGAGLATDKAVAEKAKVLFPGVKGFSEKNIYNYRTRQVMNPPDRDFVEKLARIHNGLPEDWVRQVLPDNTAQSFLREADTILEMQKQLNAGDSVTIIAVREFLESTNIDVAEIVVNNLSKGVRYTYCFPQPSSGPHGDVAQRSFAKFMADRVMSGAFKQPPKIFGFAVDSGRFPYFTPLCTLVRFESTKHGLTNCFGFIEIAKDDNGSVLRSWYAIEESEWNKIKASLELARSPVSEDDLPIYPLNPQLRSISAVYTNWFSNKAHVREYRKLRDVLGHAGDTCVEYAEKALAAHTLDGDVVRYLDIGCGDAEITKRIAEQLTHRKQTVVTGIDVAPSQIDSAKTTLKTFQGQSDLRVTSFEKFSPGTSFHVITAIHSLYVVDEAYLRRVFQLLAPGGIALVWMACGEQNIVHALTQRLDEALWRGQRRNTAQDILAAAQYGGLSPYPERSERSIPSLLDGKGQPTLHAGQLIDYCALKTVERGSAQWVAAVKVLTEMRNEKGEHPLHDLLITVKRRPTHA